MQNNYRTRVSLRMLICAYLLGSTLLLMCTLLAMGVAFKLSLGIALIYAFTYSFVGHLLYMRSSLRHSASEGLVPSLQQQLDQTQRRLLDLEEEVSFSKSIRKDI